MLHCITKALDMGTPPEVLLDRFLRSDLRRAADREMYRGKKDLERLEPGLGSLLTSVQTTFNKALSQRGNTFARGRASNFHFDYVDATRSNAMAFELEGYAFIVVTMPFIEELWQTCDQVSRSVQVMGHLKQVATDQQRAAVLAQLFATQLSFVVAHEFAHHDRGHLPHQDSSTDLWNEIPTGGTAGSLEQQAQEVDADGWAVYLVLSNLLIGEWREGARTLLELRAATDDTLDEILLSSFVLAVANVLFIFPQKFFDERELYKLVHPPAVARLDRIMANVQTWCEQNRPSLRDRMTLGRFQELMRAAREATSELSVETIRCSRRSTS
jgi:hypothetical protein